MDWISCKERLPDIPKYTKDLKEYLITVQHQDILYIMVSEYRESGWKYINEQHSKILAWAELPEPYQGK